MYRIQTSKVPAPSTANWWSIYLEWAKDEQARKPQTAYGDLATYMSNHIGTLFIQLGRLNDREGCEAGR